MSDAFQFGLKVAEIMLPGAQPPSRGMDLSALSSPSTLPPLTGPLKDDFSPGSFSASLAKSMDPDPLTGVDPRMKALMDANDQKVHTDALQVAAAPHVKLQQEAAQRQIAADAAKQRAQASVNAWVNQGSYSDPVFGGGSPAEQAQSQSDFWRDFKHYGYNNPVWRMARGIGRFADAATEPHNSDRPLRAGWRAMMGPRDPNSFIARTGRAIDHAYGAAEDIKTLTGQAVDNTKQTSVSPEDIAAAQAAPKPTLGSYLSDSLKNNSMWLLPAAGLGGLGVYGLYKALQARKDAKRRRRLMSPAAITY